MLKKFLFNVFVDSSFRQSAQPFDAVASSLTEDETAELGLPAVRHAHGPEQRRRGGQALQNRRHGLINVGADRRAA